MSNGNGGQTNDWNYWRHVARQQGAILADEKNTAAAKAAGGATESTMTDAEKRRQTATEIARKRLIETYNKSGVDIKEQESYKEATTASPAPKVNAEEWKKYHSAWQNYYQKYYGEYYGKAARDYVAKERLRLQREQADAQKRDAKDEITGKAPDPAIDVQQVEDNYREKIRKMAVKRAKKVRKSRHFIPITAGLIVILVGVFMQYNQVIVGNVMAYMSPGNNVVNDISAIDPTITLAVHEEPTLMIPKLNIEVPVVFGSGNSVSEMNVAMDNGVAHFAVPGASAVPGQIGNYVVSGHSAGNIYQQSNYKFIFSGLTRMATDDLIYMDYNGIRYTYRVTGTRTVEPTDVASLREIADSNTGKPMITLITCTPLGTSRYRLLVYGEQIYPSYEDASSTGQATDTEKEEEVEMPHNEGSPFEEIWKWLTGQQ